MKESIKVHWCYIDNFGDALNPYLLEKLTGKRSYIGTLKSLIIKGI